jgi:hypothetical protein
MMLLYENNLNDRRGCRRPDRALTAREQANAQGHHQRCARRGLHDTQIRPKPRKPFRTQGYDMGPSLVNIDNVAEAIAHAEGEDFKGY